MNFPEELVGPLMLLAFLPGFAGIIYANVLERRQKSKCKLIVQRLAEMHAEKTAKLEELALGFQRLEDRLH